jgi:hypothetical protein
LPPLLLDFLLLLAAGAGAGVLDPPAVLDAEFPAPANVSMVCTSMGASLRQSISRREAPNSDCIAAMRDVNKLGTAAVTAAVLSRSAEAVLPGGRLLPLLPALLSLGPSTSSSHTQLLALSPRQESPD